MRVTVFGATGATGRHVVAQALAAGHEVTALVRDPAAADQLDPAVTVEVGDARDPVAVGRAVAGAEAVISTIGSHTLRRSTMITDCMRTVVAALPERTRLLAMSTVGAGDSGAQMSPVVRATIGVLLRSTIADHNGQEAAIMTSLTDWTIARCVALSDGPARGSAHVHTEGRVGGGRVSREDVAAWLVAALTDRTWSRRVVTLW